MKKKLLSMLLVVMAVAMVGCGKKDETTTNVEPKPGQVTVEEILAQSAAIEAESAAFTERQKALEAEHNSPENVAKREAEAKAAAEKVEANKAKAEEEAKLEELKQATSVEALGVSHFYIDACNTAINDMVASGEFETFGEAVLYMHDFAQAYCDAGLEEDIDGAAGKLVLVENYTEDGIARLRNIGEFPFIFGLTEDEVKDYVALAVKEEETPVLVVTSEPEPEYDKNDVNKDGIINYKDVAPNTFSAYARHFIHEGIVETKQDAIPLAAEHFDNLWETGRFNTPDDVSYYLYRLEGIYDPEAPLDEAIISKYCNK